MATKQEQINMRISPDKLLEFKAYCEINDTTMSRKLERHIDFLLEQARSAYPEQLEQKKKEIARQEELRTAERKAAVVGTKIRSKGQHK